MIPAPDYDRKDGPARATPRGLSAVCAERRSVKLHVDVDLIVKANVTHSGACLYAALSWLWYENVGDVSTLARLEQASGRKRLDPVIVTAEALYPLTGLRKDAITARMRELETPRPCIWRGCLEPHPLITVRRIGQGQGLQVQRYFCGDPAPVSRKRVVFQNPAVPPSGRIAQNPEVPDLRIRRSPPQEPGSDPTQNAAPPDSLIRSDNNNTTSQQFTAAADGLEERRTLVQRLVPRVLGLARIAEPDATIEHAARRTGELVDAALRYHGSVPAAALALNRAVDDKRVIKASRPLAMLLRGVLGEQQDGADAFLLTQPVPSPETPVPPLGALGAMPAGLRETLLQRVRDGDLNPGWLARNGIPPQALRDGRELIADESAPFPLCERLRIADPEEYNRKLSAALEQIDLPKRLGVVPTLDSAIFAAAAKRRLETDLATEAEK